MESIGKTLLFDYGEFAVRVHYISSSLLEWEQTKGDAPGSKGEESYQAVELAPRMYLVWWQEKDASVISQVVDLEKRRVHTNWISPDTKVQYFEGKITLTG